jgi:hypothetical protein
VARENGKACTTARACRAAAVAAAIALAAVAAGCGGSNHPSATATTTTTASPLKLGKVAYEKTMRTLGNRLGKSINGLYPLPSGAKGSATAEQTVVKLQNAKSVVAGVLAQLNRIVPPKPIVRQHRELVSGVRVLVRQLGTVIKDAQTGDIGGFVAGSNFTVGLQMINAAANSMTDRGYNIIGPDAALNP